MLSHLMTFVFLGVVQIFMAVWGGIVSVNSLSDGQNKTLHRWMFFVLGTVGTLLIVLTGLQAYEAERDDLKFRSDATAAQNAIQHRLDQSSAAQNTMNGELLASTELLSQIKASGTGSAGVKELAAAMRQLLQTNAQLAPKQESFSSDMSSTNPKQSPPSANPAVPIAGQLHPLKTIALTLAGEINKWADERLKEGSEDSPTNQTPEGQKKAQAFHEIIVSEWQDRYAAMAGITLSQLLIVEHDVLKIPVPSIHACYANINLGSGNRGLLNTRKMCAGFIQQAAEKLN